MSLVGTWLLAILSSIYAVVGFGGMVFMAVYALVKGLDYLLFYITAPVLFFLCQFIRAILRQTMIRKLLKDNLEELKPAIIADLCFFWLWSILLLIFTLSSAFGRVITWRGIKYKMISPTETIIID